MKLPGEPKALELTLLIRWRIRVGIHGPRARRLLRYLEERDDVTIEDVARNDNGGMRSRMVASSAFPSGE